jgi:hypothetical protein
MNSLNQLSLDHSPLFTSMGCIVFGYVVFLAAMAGQVLHF